MKQIIAIICAFGLLFEVETLFGEDLTKQQDSQLQGSWDLVYQQINGKKMPDEKTAEMSHGKMVISGDKIHYTVDIPGFDFEFKYQLDKEHNPKTIDLELIKDSDDKGLGLKLLGIYRLQEGKLEICYSKTNRPTGFNANEDSHNVLIELKR